MIIKNIDNSRLMHNVNILKLSYINAHIEKNYINININILCSYILSLAANN